MHITTTNRGLWSLPLILGLLFLLSLAWLAAGSFQTGSISWQILLTTAMLSVPLGLMYISIGVLVNAAQQVRNEKKIGRRSAAFIYRTPRITNILLILIVAILALNALSIHQSIQEMVVKILVSALPVVPLTIILALAWKWEWIGSVSFCAVVIYLLPFLIRNPLQELGTLLLFIGPMLAVALLFWANWLWRDMLRAALHRV